MRVTLKIDFPVTKLPDEDYRKELIFNATTNAKDLYADGVNIDIEQIVKKGSTEEEALTLFSKELTEAFHKEIPGSQVKFFIIVYSYHRGESRVWEGGTIQQRPCEA